MSYLSVNIDLDGIENFNVGKPCVTDGHTHLSITIALESTYSVRLAAEDPASCRLLAKALITAAERLEVAASASGLRPKDVPSCGAGAALEREE